MNPKIEETLKALRFEADIYVGGSTSVVCEAAADLIEQLQQELIDERYRHDRLQDFCVAQGEELSRLKEQQRWIPVTERLPEDGITVLTFDKRGHVRDRALYTFRGGQRLFRPDGLAPGYGVLYWMPLPEPPKEENHDKDIEPELVERVTHKPDAQLRPLRDMDEIKYYMGEEPKE